MSNQVEELREAASDLHTTAHWMADDAAFTSTVEVLRELGESLKGLSTVVSAFVPHLGWIEEPMNRVGEELAKTMPASFRHKAVWDTVTDAVKETGIAISKATATGRISHSAFHKLWDVSVAMMELERIGPEADPGLFTLQPESWLN